MTSLPQTGSREESGVRPIRVLLAEDHVLSQTITVRLLQAEGYEVFVVMNGYDAVAACQEQTFDFVLMDLRLPGMGGLDAIRAIRKEALNSEARPMQIWALTADSANDVKTECIQAGADGHLAKPLKRQQLVKLFSGRSHELSGEPSDTPDHRTILLENVGHDPTLAKNLTDLFLTDFDSLFQRLSTFIQFADFSALSCEAHSLKSPARIFGAKKLHQLCDVIEQVAKNCEGKQLAAVGDEFLAELKRLQDAVSQLVFDDAE